MKTNIEPIEGVILIETYEEKINSALALPGNLKKRDLAGRVVAVGAPVRDARIKDLMHFPPCKVGDVIIHQTYYSEPYTDFKTGKVYKFIKFENVLAIIKEL